jgi:magnesium transporter
MSQDYVKPKNFGLPPGTPVYVGDEEPQPSHITLMTYDEKNFDEKEVTDVDDANIEELCGYLESPDVTWVNVDGLDVNVIDKLGRRMGFHPLIIEDIMNTTQRPKVEEYDKYVFIVLKMLTYNGEKSEVDAEQVSLVLCGQYVVSFQEKLGDIFDPLRDRIRNSKGIVRKMGADFLGYSLIDAIVDGYFVILEQLGDQIEDLEDEIVEEPDAKTVQEIHILRRQMITLRKSVWPLREVISRLDRLSSQYFKETTSLYLRDVYDHTIQVIDSIETYRDLLSGMLDIYLSSVSNKMNEIMKVLTVIGTIFIPLTFIVGIFGMNFKYFPGLDWTYGYPVVWGVMIVIAFIMILFFRRMDWL